MGVGIHPLEAWRREDEIVQPSWSNIEDHYSATIEQYQQNRTSQRQLRTDHHTLREPFMEWLQIEAIDEPYVPIFPDFRARSGRNSACLTRIMNLHTRIYRLGFSSTVEQGLPSTAPESELDLLGIGTWEWPEDLTETVRDQRDNQLHDPRSMVDPVLPLPPIHEQTPQYRPKHLRHVQSSNVSEEDAPRSRQSAITVSGGATAERAEHELLHSCEPHHQLTEAAMGQSLTPSDRYQSEIRNIASLLVYAWLERNRGQLQSAWTQQHRFRENARSSDKSAGHIVDGNENKARKPSQSFKRSSPANRKHQGDRSHEGRDDDDEDAHNPRRLKLENECDQIGKVWACPYCKHDPVTYSLQNNYKCSTHLLSNIARLKQHLYRVHCRPPIYCWICFTIFDTEELAQNHSRQEIRCQQAPSPFQDGMTAAQHKAVKKKHPKKTPKERWYLIYEILFPGEVLPESPFLDEASSLQSIIDDLCLYVRREAPTRLAERIRADLLQLPPGDIYSEVAVNAIVESAFACFADLVDARAMARGPPGRPQILDHSDGSSSPIPELTSGSTDGTSTVLVPGALNDCMPIMEASTEIPGAVNGGRHLIPSRDGDYDVSTDLPEFDDTWLRFLDFNPVSKSGDIGNGLLPQDWAPDG